MFSDSMTDDRYWQVVPIFDCSWKKRMLIITGPCTGLDKVVSVVVSGGSFVIVIVIIYFTS